MDRQTITKVSQNVYRSFPELRGKPPQVRTQKSPGEETFILIYKGSAVQPNGKRIPRNVRVVADAQGKILRMSTSR
jgi:hypothetical protein